MSANLRIFPLFIATGILSCAEPSTIDLFDGFGPGWRDSWEEQRLFTKATQYQAVQEDGTPALHAISLTSNAGLLRRLNIDKTTKGTHLEWQWRVKAPLGRNHSERKRSGDDYAARVCIVFEDSIIPLRTRSLHYVWAAHEPVNTVYASPYSSRVGMFVLRSGENEQEQWLQEDRDVFADYRRYFGSEPTRIAAVGIVVDTDNTDAEAEAWFRFLFLSTPTEESAH